MKKSFFVIVSVLLISCSKESILPESSIIDDESEAMLLLENDEVLIVANNSSEDDDNETEDSEMISEGGTSGTGSSYSNKRVGDANSGYYLYYYLDFLKVKVNYSKNSNNNYIISVNITRASSTGMPITITTQYLNYSTLPDMNSFHIEITGYWTHSSPEVGYPNNQPEFFYMDFTVNCLD